MNPTGLYHNPRQSTPGTMMPLAALLISLISFTGCLATYDSEDAKVSNNGNSGGNNGGSGSVDDCTPSQEICDGSDNDCDNAIDEDFPLRGVQCGNNIGICSAVFICEGGVEQCYPVQEPDTEVCDGLDNNCDGLIDEVTESDPNNCGTCNNVCSFTNGTATCDSGACALLTCDEGFEECDGDPENGCETDTTSDSLNCGSCGNICSDDSAATICEAGVCAIQMCLGERMDCNNFALDGCEADLEVDVFNCGGCNVRCEFDNAQSQCLDRMCIFDGCQSGFADRDLLPENGCEMGLNIISSPPDAALGNLIATSERLYGSADNRIFGYALQPDGSIGALLFTHTTSSPVIQLDAEDNRVFASLDAGDVQILDTSDPVNISVEGIAFTTGPSPGFTRTADHLIIADGRDGLKIVDVSTPAAPRTIGRSVSSNLVTRAYVSGNRAFLNSPERPDMDLYDISDLSKPSLIATIPLSANFDKAILSGDLLITALAGGSVVKLYRLSETSATFLGDTTLSGNIADMTLRGQFLVIIDRSTNNTTKLDLLDIRRPQRPTIITSFSGAVSNSPRSAAFTENQVYIAGERGLQRFDITDLRNPIGAQDLVRPQQLRDIVIQSGKMFVASDGAVEVLDITDPGNPRRTARFGEDIYKITTTSDTLIVTSDTYPVARYALATLSDDPTPLSVFNGLRPSAIDSSRDGRFVYAINGSTLNIIEMITPSDQESVIRGSLLLDSSCTDIFRDPRGNESNYLYLACNNGLVLVNANSAESPAVITSISGDSLYDLHLFGQTLYGLADSSIWVYRTIQTGDIVSRGAVSLVNITGLRHITAPPQGTWMVASSSTAITLFDRGAEFLESPLRVLELPLLSTVELTADNNFIYAGTNQGVFRLDVEEP